MKKEAVEKIERILKEHKGELKEKYKIKEMGMFGSFVRDEQRKRSDLDILIEFEKPIDFFMFLELEDLLSQITGVKVDLIVKKTLKPGIGKYILEEVIYV